MMTLRDRAWGRAQRRFKAMLHAYFRDETWDTPEARLYLQSDRLVGRLEDAELTEAWLAERELLLDQDHDYHQRAGITVHRCDDCVTIAEPGYSFDYQTEAEARYAFGDR